MPQYQLAVEAYQMPDGNYVIIRSEGGIKKAIPTPKAEFEALCNVEPAAKPAPARPVISEVAATPTPVYCPSGFMTPTTTSAGRWEGDMWIEPDGYRVARRFVEKYPHLYGPCASNPDGTDGDYELTDDALAKLFQRVSGPGGIFSTAAEQHCFETAAEIAYNYIEHEEDIPPVPSFWKKEGHYWLSGITSGRLVKKKNMAEAAALAMQTLPGLLENPAVLKRVTAIATAAMAAGAVVLPPVVQYLLKTFGGS